ncbi:hypothetical protein GCM10007895_29790 [Paraferrimonas sedimenticola]|uniref:Ribonuclease P protein component n=1 Tax=Paraferrimonas sedimenticola TaxID=375674 RepID=A0AA37RZR4_9GAMM|nr:hypothetical protein GCM10007895_29790 [Paraferrimonas sedimenticola]
MAKKQIKLACRRNRVKRLIRESFRQHQHDLPAVDIVAICKKDMQNMDNEQIHKMVTKLWRKLSRRCNG